MATVQAGSRVTIEYVGTLTSGEVFDDTTGRGPVSFIVGNGDVLAGFDTAVVGMSVGEEKVLTLEPGEAYGERDEDAVQVVPNDAFDSEMDIQPGTYIIGENENGQFPARVVAVASNGVTIDMNHPLAGQTLNFNFTVTDVEEVEVMEFAATPTDEENSED